MVTCYLVIFRGAGRQITQNVKLLQKITPTPSINSCNIHQHILFSNIPFLNRHVLARVHKHACMHG